MSDIILVPVNFEEGHDRQVHLEIHNTGLFSVVYCAARLVKVFGDNNDKLVDATESFDKNGNYELAWLDGNPSCGVLIQSGDFRVVDIARLEPSGVIKFRSNKGFVAAHEVKQDVIHIKIEVDVEYGNGQNSIEVLSGDLVREYDPEDREKQRLLWYTGDLPEILTA